MSPRQEVPAIRDCLSPCAVDAPPGLPIEESRSLKTLAFRALRSHVAHSGLSSETQGTVGTRKQIRRHAGELRPVPARGSYTLFRKPVPTVPLVPHSSTRPPRPDKSGTEGQAPHRRTD